MAIPISLLPTLFHIQKSSNITPEQAEVERGVQSTLSSIYVSLLVAAIFPKSGRSGSQQLWRITPFPSGLRIRNLERLLTPLRRCSRQNNLRVEEADGALQYRITKSLPYPIANPFCSPAEAWKLLETAYYLQGQRGRKRWPSLPEFLLRYCRGKQPSKVIYLKAYGKSSLHHEHYIITYHIS